MSPTLRLKLDPWQKEFLEAEGDKMLYSGRQVGKSEICAMDCGEYVRTHPGETVLMIAPTERQAYALFEKTLNYILSNYPKLIKKKPTQTHAELSNKTELWCLPVGISGVGIRFLTINRLYGEEASRIPDKVWSAVTPMLFTTHGSTILLSTFNGAEGFFYEASINKNHAYDSFKRFTINSEWVAENRAVCETWTQAQKDGAISYLKKEKARMTASEYAQEYLAIPSESIRRFFPDALIEQVCTLKRRDQLIPNRDYFLGCDFGRMGNDSSTFEIIDGEDREHMEQVENIVTNKTLLTQSFDKIIELDRIFEFIKVGLDSAGIGAGIFDFCLREDQVRRKVEALENAKRALDMFDVRSAKLMKEEGYTIMKALMEKNKLKLLDDDELIQSLKSIQFEYDPNFRIFSNYGHITEGLWRAVYLAQKKSLNIYYY